MCSPERHHIQDGKATRQEPRVLLACNYFQFECVATRIFRCAFHAVVSGMGLKSVPSHDKNTKRVIVLA